jgi:hypothetical protein
MNFLACDREQAFLMLPDPRDWLPEGHLAWFVLASVEEMGQPGKPYARVLASPAPG